MTHALVNAEPTVGHTPMHDIVWCRREKSVMQRSKSWREGYWRQGGIGMIHVAGAAFAFVIITAALLSKVVGQAFRPAMVAFESAIVPMFFIIGGVWAYRRFSVHFTGGTPAGPVDGPRVQCSASTKAKKRLGTLRTQAFEPEMFSVWLCDSHREAGYLATILAALAGAAFMACANWIAFGTPFVAAFITIGLAGSALGVAILSVLFPVEWVISPGQLQIVCPGVLGMGWRARTHAIDLTTARVFVDADARTATILTGDRRLNLRWDVLANADEITRTMLQATATMPDETAGPSSA